MHAVWVYVQKPKKESVQPVQEGQETDKPKTTRAERRAKQEAERAAKEAGVVKVCTPELPSIVAIAEQWGTACAYLCA